MNVVRPAKRRRRGMIVAAIAVAFAFVLLVALGTWQLERKSEKEALLASLRARLSVSVPLPPPQSWEGLSRADTEYHRVTFPAEFVPNEEALVYSAGSAFRPDVSGPGYWVFAPARLPGGSIVVVNRGFIPEDKKAAADQGSGGGSGFLDIVGAIRWPEARNAFTPADNPNSNLWFARDPLAMAQAKGWGRVAPFYVEQEAPTPPGGWPRPGRLEPRLPNNHLQYALTWYGLAAALLGVFVFWARGRLRAPPSRS